MTTQSRRPCPPARLCAPRTGYRWRGAGTSPLIGWPSLRRCAQFHYDKTGQRQPRQLRQLGNLFHRRMSRQQRRCRDDKARHFRQHRHHRRIGGRADLNGAVNVFTDKVRRAVVEHPLHCRADSAGEVCSYVPCITVLCRERGLRVIRENHYVCHVSIFCHAC